MNRRRRFLAVRSLSTLALIVMTAFAQEQKSALTLPHVEILGTQLLKIRSAIVGQDYDLMINLPRNYRDTTKAFPVLYLLDAQWDFPLVNAVFGEQYYDGCVPEIVTVGIAWGGKTPNYDSLRVRDLTPTTIKQVPQSGNAPRFLEFIKKELIPFIDSKYRTVRDERTLMGSSLGGLFTVYAMFHETGLFNRYVLTSPSLQWDNEVAYSYEKNYAAKNSQLPVKLFMAMGELEPDVAGFQKFVGQLKGRNYRGLNIQTRILEETGHSASKAEGYSRGLQAVFARPSLTIDPAILLSYVGKYQISPEMTVQIVKENDRLALLAPDGMKLVLTAETEREFYVKGMYLFLRFQKGDAGKITGCQVEQFQGGAFVKRVE